MSTLITLAEPDAPPRLTLLPEGCYRPAPDPLPRPDIARINAGQGDSRGRIRPNVKLPETPSVRAWEGGAMQTLAEWREIPVAPGVVVLMPGEDPAHLAGDFARLARIAVEVASFTDGRAYSTAVLLRRRFGWRGPLRAVGAVLVDQAAYLARCGFDELALRADQDVEAALAALALLPHHYQADPAARPTLDRSAA